MYTAKSSEQTCCTCNYWMGTRVVVEDGLTYSPRNVAGICGIKARDAAMTLPSADCSTWGRWYGLGLA